MRLPIKGLSIIGISILLIVSLWMATPLVARMTTIEGISVDGNISRDQELAVYNKMAKMDIQEQGIRAVKTQLLDISWIEHVSVKRDWPDALRVTVKPRDAMALWNDRDYLDLDGLVFDSPFVPSARLPQLYGPEGTERQVMSQYHQLSRVLNPYDQRIDTLTLNAMGGWRFHNRDGIDVELGKDDVHERLQRFIQVMNSESLFEHKQDIESVDTRYPNGVAVGWKNDNRIVHTESYQQGRE